MLALFTIGFIIAMFGFMIDTPFNALEGMAGLMFLAVNLALVIPIYIIGNIMWIVIFIIKRVKAANHEYK